MNALPFILAAYGVTAAVLIALVATSLHARRAARLKLEALRKLGAAGERTG